MLTERVSTPPRLIPSTRFTIALLVSFALFTQYAQRLSLSMAIVCMVNRTHIDVASKNHSYSNQAQNIVMPTGSIKYGSRLLEEKQFFFNEFEQQILLGAYWFGATFGLIPGGWLSLKIGAKRTFLFGVLLSSIASLLMALIYFVHKFHLILAVILRILIGFGHGPLFPATYTVWAMWAVPLERGTLTAIGFCSTNLGTAIMMLIGGLLCRYVTSGWVYIFILSSIFGFIWMPLWLWKMADFPQSHRTISERERSYLCEHRNIIADIKKKQSVSFTSLPWKKIIRSRPILALFVTQSCNLFGLFFFYTNIGKLLTEIHGVPTQYAGYILAGGFLLMPIVSLSSGIIADRLLRSKKMTLTNIRKLFNSIASFIAAACMIIFCFCDHTRQPLGIVTVITLLAGSATAYGAGYVVNFADIAPAYSSIIFAATSTVATVGALASNFIAGLIIKRPVLEDWRKLFILFAIVYIIGGIGFLLFGSAVPRKWALFNAEQPKVNDEAEALTMLPSKSDETKAKQSIHLPE